ncbi:MAG: hypothetical protein ABFQ89_04495 [Chloroflexota bacterium]
MSAITQGLMWYDDNPQTTFAEKIERAVEHYHSKFGHAPDRCLVMNGDSKRMLDSVGSVQVHAVRDMLPHHFLIGVAEGDVA